MTLIVEKTYADWAILILALLGLLAVGVGAWITARAVIIDDKTAEMLAGTYWGGNNALRDALIGQSRAAQSGLYWIAGGSVLQIAGVVLQAVKG